jgi:tRNA threonylcarbamoyl adenosine modification protein YeaZ
VRTVLALLGCAGRVEVALASPSLAAPSVVALASPEPRANLLLQAVHQVLQAAQLRVSDLELVVATTGPGSFTGIRNTLACAWGFAQACHLPVHGFSSLLVQAARSGEAEVLAVQPARKGWFYAQPFVCKEGWMATAPVEVLRQEEWQASLCRWWRLRG